MPRLSGISTTTVKVDRALAVRVIRVYPGSMSAPIPQPKLLFRRVFFFEAWIVNGGVAVWCFLFPGAFLAQFVPGSVGPVAETLRWYGVLLGVLAVVMLRALAARDDRVLKPAVEGLLFGDLAHLAACVFWFLAVPEPTLPSVTMVVTSVLLAGCRAAWLVLDARERRADPNWNL